MTVNWKLCCQVYLEGENFTFMLLPFSMKRVSTKEAYYNVNLTALAIQSACSLN